MLKFSTVQPRHALVRPRGLDPETVPTEGLPNKNIGHAVFRQGIGVMIGVGDGHRRVLRGSDNKSGRRVLGHLEVVAE